MRRLGTAGPGTAPPPGVGVSKPVLLNRSSSSARAEYLSPVDWTGGATVLDFLRGGRAGGGAVRGSERLLVLTAHGEHMGLGATAQLAASNSVQSWIPRRRDESVGSSGGKEQRGARNGLVHVLETGGGTGAIEEERNGLKDFLIEGLEEKGLIDLFSGDLIYSVGTHA